MTRAELFNQLSLMFDDDAGSLDAEEWTEQMEGAKHAITKFERAAMAKAIRYVMTAGPWLGIEELRELADDVERGEVTPE